RWSTRTSAIRRSRTSARRPRASRRWTRVRRYWCRRTVRWPASSRSSAASCRAPCASSCREKRTRRRAAPSEPHHLRQLAQAVGVRLLLPGVAHLQLLRGRDRDDLEGRVVEDTQLERVARRVGTIAEEL